MYGKYTIHFHPMGMVLFGVLTLVNIIAPYRRHEMSRTNLESLPSLNVKKNHLVIICDAILSCVIEII